MKCLLVVNRINDIFFVDFDDDFAAYVNRQAAEAGLIGPDIPDLYHVDPNIFMQLFSPLVLSNWGLIEETKNPCSAVTSENGFIFVFRQVDDLLYIAINGDGTESEQALRRKCLVFLRLVGFLFGPIKTEIAHSRFEDKKERWNFLQRLMDTWMKLQKNEQSFLVEAVERVFVNQLVNEKCIELLEESMNKAQSVLDRPAQHSLLLVNSKLLALYSDRNAYELQAPDILSIILLVQDIFPSKEKLEDLFSQSFCQSSQPCPKRSHSFIPSTAKLMDGRKEDDSDLDEEQYHSAPTTPTTTPSEERSRTPAMGIPPTSATPDSLEEVEGEEQQHASHSEESRSSSAVSLIVGSPYPDVSTHGDSEPFFTPKSDLDENRDLKDEKLTTSQGSETTNSTVGRPQLEASASLGESSTASSKLHRAESDIDYWRQMIFLQTPTCPFSPHQLHCTSVLPGIVFVTIIEGGRGSVADPLCQMFRIIKDLLSGRKDKLSRAQGQYLYDVMNSLLSKVQGPLRKVKGDTERILNEVRKRWENEGLKTNLLSYLEEEAGVEVPTGLDTALSDLLKKLKDLFSYLYLSPRQVNEALKDTIMNLRTKMQKELSDYRHYISVKAQRNIPMTSYLDEFPGLIHFIFIDRQSHQLTTPSLNITHEEYGKKDATQYLKDKVWGMQQCMMQKLSEGYTTIMMRDGDFYFSYFLWFEDSVGNPLSVQQPFKPSFDIVPPGILTGSFYRQLSRQCFPNSIQASVHCYELFLMHVGLVHPQYIASHCRKLAKKLWEITGEAYIPISLL